MTQIQRKHLRRLLICGLVSLSSAGCASLKSPTEWFSKDTSEPKTSLTTKASEAGKGISGQFKSMGTAVGSAYSKTKAAVSNTFTTRKSNLDPDDPTSLASMPSNLGPEIWVTNGQLYESKSNYAKALDNYTKALELEPENLSALLSTARLYSRQKEHQQAVEFYKKALAVKPDAQTYNELAVAYHDQGNLAEAQASARQAIELDEGNTRYRNNLAGILVKTGRSDEAVRELEQVFPPAVANYNVAYLHVQNSNYAAAQQHLQTALLQDPSLSQARDLMDRLGSTRAAQSAMAAYETAQSIYRTAEGTAGPNVNANEAVYQKPAAATQPFAASQSLPQVPQTQPNTLIPTSLPGPSAQAQSPAQPQ